MMEFYLEFTNGDVEFFEAKTDHSAWSKAQKLAKQNDTGIAYLAESYDESEVDRIIYQR